MLMKETPCLQSERLHREMVTFAHGTPAIALIWWAPSSRHNMSKDSDFQHVGDGHDQHRLSVFFPCNACEVGIASNDPTPYPPPPCKLPL